MVFRAESLSLRGEALVAGKVRTFESFEIIEAVEVVSAVGELNASSLGKVSDVEIFEVSEQAVKLIAKAKALVIKPSEILLFMIPPEEF
jgi:hypothetical protein